MNRTRLLFSIALTIVSASVTRSNLAAQAPKDTLVRRVMKPGDAGQQGEPRRIIRQNEGGVPANPDPSETAALAFVRALNAPEAGVLETFLKARLGPAAIAAQSVADRMKAYRKIHEDNGMVGIADVEINEPNTAQIMLGAPKTHQKISMHIAADDEGKITSLVLTPVTEK